MNKDSKSVMSENKPLFEVYSHHLESGLRSIPVGYCVTSQVDPTTGLYYCSSPVSSLTHYSPCEVIYLLLEGHLPSKKELSTFQDKLKTYSSLPPALVEHIRQLPRSGHPMKMLSSALLLHAMVEEPGNTNEEIKQDLFKVIARIPQICAHIINHHGGFGPTPALDMEKGYIEQFTELLNIPNKSDDFIEVMRLFNILHYDHGGGNLSCFTGKVVASGHEDLWGALSASMSALAGPRHGKANQDCLAQVQELHHLLGTSYSKKNLTSLLRKRLVEKKLLYGFGHAVLRVEDPRATIFYHVAQKNSPNDPLVKLALDLRQEGTAVLKENPKIANPYPNVDAISGVLLHSCGFKYPEYYTLLFGMSRIVGIAIQVCYDRFYAREGKGTVIVRPKFLYKDRGSASFLK